MKDCTNIVTIGGGFIGVEISDELNKRDKQVTIIEILPHVLSLAFDKDIACKAQDTLISRGVHVISGVGVKEIVGKKKTDGVLLQNGKKPQARHGGGQRGYLKDLSPAPGGYLTVHIADKGPPQHGWYGDPPLRDIKLPQP